MMVSSAPLVLLMAATAFPGMPSPVVAAFVPTTTTDPCPFMTHAPRPIAFATNHLPRASTRLSMGTEGNDDGGGHQEKKTWQDRLDKVDDFLDTPIFDPDDERSADSWFGQLVQNDYDAAEALYAGAFLAFMVLLSQELFRIMLYGENYVPFKAGGAVGGSMHGLW